MTHIQRIVIHRLSLPLRVPYKLAFGPVTAFDTVICEVTLDNGKTGFGEATILTGYTPETIAGCWQTALRLANESLGLCTEDAKTEALVELEDAPFTVTAFVTAIEMAEGHAMLADATGARVPLLAILSATTPGDIEAEIADHVAAGYETIKVKVGWDVEDDLKRTAFIQSCLPNGVQIRIDGNQGFSPTDGITFASSLDPAGIELLEQPCHMDDWAAAKAVAEVCTAPFMLDESIYGDAEIERAAEMGGVQYIKLKLMKAGSLDNLARQLSRILELGMKPVLGNGVAADPGCWMEACVAHALIDNAGEMNGFLKPHTSIFETPLAVAQGEVVIPDLPKLSNLSLIAEQQYDSGDA